MQFLLFELFSLQLACRAFIFEEQQATSVNVQHRDGNNIFPQIGAKG
uniref:Secreted protein n=1 Tax=Phakopsora pachyrhizi TaxID=170000 RepID=A0A0S1MKL2_PHAPC